MAEREYLTENPDGSVSITLTRALTIDGLTTKVLTMREPTVEDQIAAQAGKGSTAQQEVALIANLCSVAPSDIGKLSLRDYKRVQAAFVGFLD